jgi:hypothetical protein
MEQSTKVILKIMKKMEEVSIPSRVKSTKVSSKTTDFMVRENLIMVMATSMWASSSKARKVERVN